METTHPGGINMVVQEIAKNISDIGHETIVLQPYPNLSDEEIYEGFKIIRISSSRDKYFYGLRLGIYQYLKNNLKEINPDVIHVNGYHTLLSIELIKEFVALTPT
jgi:flavodoxin